MSLLTYELRKQSGASGGGDASAANQLTIIAGMADLLSELQQKLEAGQAVALDPATLAALESITATVANWPSDFPDAAVLAKLEQVRALAASVDAKLPASTTRPAAEDVSAPPSRPVNSKNTRVSFCKTGAGLISSEMVQIGTTGTGIGVNQSSGNLVITSGTTANAEFLARSVDSFKGMRTLLQSTVLSQRIAQNNFDVWLADLVGTLPFTVNSATSVTFDTTSLGSNPFDGYVGGSVEIGGIDLASCVPGTAVVASVSGADVTFTVAGWPSSGTGTATLCGFNAMMLRYQGTTATNASFTTRRNGWNAAYATATVNTTASPGHITRSELSHESATLGDRLRASNTGAAYSWRADSPDNIPSNEVELYVFVRCLNGTSNPATTTTWTLGFWDCVESSPMEVDVILRGQNSDQRPIATRLVGTSAVSLTSTTANIGMSGITAYTDSSTNLAGAATFTGTSRDAGSINGYSRFTANATSDVAGTLRVEKSTDNSTWRLAESVAVGANEGKSLNVPVTTRYMRVVYVNGASAQGVFLLTSAYNRI